LRLDPTRLFVRDRTLRAAKRPARPDAGDLRQAQERALEQMGVRPVQLAASVGPDGYEPALRKLQAAGSAAQAAPALFTEGGMPLWLGPELVVGLQPGERLDAVADLMAQHQLEALEQFAPGEWRLRSALGPLAALRAADALYESGRVRYAHPDFGIPIESY